MSRSPLTDKLINDSPLLGTVRKYVLSRPSVEVPSYYPGRHRGVQHTLNVAIVDPTVEANEALVVAAIREAVTPIEAKQEDVLFRALQLIPQRYTAKDLRYFVHPDFPVPSEHAAVDGAVAVVRTPALAPDEVVLTTRDNLVWGVYKDGPPFRSAAIVDTPQILVYIKVTA